MKRLLNFFLLVFLCSCIKTKQQKAEQLVRDYIVNRLDDPNSYESVGFDHFDTLFVNLMETKEGKELYNAKLDSALSNKKEKELRDKYHNIVGWSIWHSYRAKNAAGGLTLDSAYFAFDKDLTKVTKTIK